LSLTVLNCVDESLRKVSEKKGHAQDPMGGFSIDGYLVII